MAIMVPQLLQASRLLTMHAALILALLPSQTLSVWSWALASISDPGYCQPTVRLDADELGPDGHERLVIGVQMELNELLRKKYKLISDFCNARCISFEAAEQLMLQTPSGERELLESFERGMIDGKRLLAGSLKQASAARMGCYPQDYLSFLHESDVESNLKAWNKRACLVCARLRHGRSKHCKECGVCVERFDHHCPWLGNCVGAHNLSHFLKFLFWTLLSLTLHEVLSWKFLGARPAPPEGWSPPGRLLVKVNMALGVIWLIFVGSLALRQLYLATLDLTDYEAGNGGDSCRSFCSMPCGERLRNMGRVLLQRREGARACGEAAPGAVLDLERGWRPRHKVAVL